MVSPITVEVHRDSATLNFRGPLGLQEVSDASAACSRLPAEVQILRVNLHGISLDSTARECITALIREWRSARTGQVILSVTSGDLDSLTA